MNKRIVGEMFIAMKGLKITNALPSDIGVYAEHAIKLKWKSNRIHVGDLCKQIGKNVHIFSGCLASREDATFYFFRKPSEQERSLVIKLWENCGA